MYETIFSPVNLGGLVLKNRIIFAPTTLGLGGEALEEKIRKIAAGGCAMIVIGGCAGVRPWRSFPLWQKGVCPL